MSHFKADNIKLQQRIKELENQLLSIVGSIKIFANGMEGKEQELNNHITEILISSEKLNVVSPYVTNEYALVLQDIAQGGKPLNLVVNDRRFWPSEHQGIYDKLKNSSGINLINNPNVKFLLIWGPEQALYCSGQLDRETFMKTILIGTFVKDKKQINDLLKIFNEMLPSFMR